MKQELYRLCLAKRSKLKQGHVIHLDWVKLDESTVRSFRLNHKISLNHKVDDLNTEARNDACSCPRMSYVVFLILWVFPRFLPGASKWNADATTYVFNALLQGSKYGVLSPDSDWREPEKDAIETAAADDDTASDGVPQANSKKRKHGKVQCNRNSNQLPFAIKNMHLCNAAGEIGRPCLVVAVKNMPADTFFVREVQARPLLDH